MNKIRNNAKVGKNMGKANKVINILVIREIKN